MMPGGSLGPGLQWEVAGQSPEQRYWGSTRAQRQFQPQALGISLRIGTWTHERVQLGRPMVRQGCGELDTSSAVVSLGQGPTVSRS